MKNILIPTQLEGDTTDAVKLAVAYADKKKCMIYLLQVYDVPDMYSAGWTLKTMAPQYTAAQSAVLDKCRQIIDASNNCRLAIHLQYGITKPLLKNLIEHKDIGLIMLTPMFIKDKKSHVLTKMLPKCTYPLLYLGYNTKSTLFNKALYIEQEKTTVGLHKVQEIVYSEFNFNIVSRAWVPNEQKPEDLAPLLAEAIFKNDIDLLVETRSADTEMKRKKNSKSVNEALGMPVLSLHEQLI
ncbi:hypothetical protein [Flavobacterium rhizosphaerae]|uniref:Universal stress protein family protein n=1 Tax=Flavobacterium rhizosphaerae TaxID=3163298 RepID=A0ABW8YT65_9FLAO